MNENIKYLNNNVLSILFASIPIFLVFGPLLPELNIILLILIMFYLKIYNFKDLNLVKFSCFFLVFYLCINISSFFSPNILLSLKSSLTYIRFYLFILVIFFLITSNQKTLFYLKNSLLIVFLVLFFDSTFQIINGKNLIGYELLRPNNVSRVSSFLVMSLLWVVL